MQGKAIVTFLVVLIIFSSAIVVIGPDEDVQEEKIQTSRFSGGFGTIDDPYQITNITHLQDMGIKRNFEKHFILMNDIDASDTSSWNSGEGFEPIGPDTLFTITGKFKGTLDGQGYKIDGLTIARDSQEYVGLFSILSEGSKISNLTLINTDIEGSQTVGSIVGQNDGGIIDNVAIEGKITGTRLVGGLVGNLYFGLINRSSCSATVEGNNNVGGLAGNIYFGDIDDSYFDGAVIAPGGTGGITGNMYGGSIMNSYVVGTIWGSTNIGGIVGGTTGGYDDIINTFYNIDSKIINNEVHISYGGIYNQQFNDWMNNGKKLHITDYSDTLVPKNGNYEINGISGLKDMLGFVNTEGLRFHLTSDIDLSEHPGFYIPCFSAELFEGNGHIIKNLNLSPVQRADLGFFGHVRRSTISGVVIGKTTFIGQNSFGSLIGRNSGGLVINCSSYATIIDARMYVGGLIGHNYGTVENCYFAGYVHGTNYVGGLMGENYGGVVKFCYFSGSVYGSENVGGIAGMNIHNISDSFVNGTVSGNKKVGGIAGYCPDGLLQNCYVSGKIIGDNQVGGLLGNNRDGTLISCFYDTESTGQSESDGGAGKTTAEMKQRTTFSNAGWDFTLTWDMIEGKTYPYFKELVVEKDFSEKTTEEIWQEYGNDTTDSDNDGLPDWWEQLNDLDPNSPLDGDVAPVDRYNKEKQDFDKSINPFEEEPDIEEPDNDLDDPILIVVMIIIIVVALMITIMVVILVLVLQKKNKLEEY